jgi:hypothetical protein
MARHQESLGLELCHLLQEPLGGATHCKDKVENSLNGTFSQRHLGLTKCQSLLGQLCSLVHGKGQLSILQAALYNKHQG